MIVDLYAGPGGWSEALRALGLAEVGIEYDTAACATRAAAGHRTVRANVGTYPTRPFGWRVEGLIASPPCPAFSSAGLGKGRDLIPEILAAIEARDWTRRPDPDPNVWLVIDLGRWLVELDPEWIACEQVPSVLPVWRAYARMLDGLGYSTWCGVLNAADYGVPQTRRRAILMAHRERIVQPPAATHDEAPVPDLFGAGLRPWVSMAEALGWLQAGDRVGFPRLDDTGTSPDGYRERDWRGADEPAHVLTEKARSWVVNTGRDWKAGGTRDDAQKVPVTDPAPTIDGKGRWFLERPATTIQGDPRVWPPGHKINADDRRRLGDEADERYGDRAGTDAIRIGIDDALVLQSFRRDYPVQGTKSKQFEQVGNAVPPRLAQHVLASLLGLEAPR